MNLETQKRIAKLVNYNGRNIKVCDFRPGMRTNSYWDSGSRDYWFYCSIDGRTLRSTVPQNGTMFDKLNLSCDSLLPGVCLVQVSIFRGKPSGCYIYLEPQQTAQELTAQD